MKYTIFDQQVYEFHNAKGVMVRLDQGRDGVEKTRLDPKTHVGLGLDRN
jgi:hypothetical protein